MSLPTTKSELQIIHPDLVYPLSLPSPYCATFKLKFWATRPLCCCSPTQSSMSINCTNLVSNWFDEIKGRRCRHSLGRGCLETNPPSRIHSGGVRLITLWNCSWCEMVIVMTTGRASRRRGSKKRVAKQHWIISGQFPFGSLWTSCSWGRKGWCYRGTVGYSKRRKRRRNGS